MSFKVKSNVLEFHFENEKAAEHFKQWLCGQGEQDYWIWMEEQERKDNDNITGLNFDYWNGNVINVECGRKS